MKEDVMKKLKNIVCELKQPWLWHHLALETFLTSKKTAPKPGPTDHDRILQSTGDKKLLVNQP